jgi:hypothetical protein
VNSIAHFASFLFDSAAPFVYNPCGCGETCKTIEDREKMIQASTALKDPANLAKLRSICSSPLQEGCFCPKGSVLHNGKCLREAECRACDDKVSDERKSRKKFSANDKSSPSRRVIYRATFGIRMCAHRAHAATTRRFNARKLNAHRRAPSVSSAMRPSRRRRLVNAARNMPACPKQQPQGKPHAPQSAYPSAPQIKRTK